MKKRIGLKHMRLCLTGLLALLGIFNTAGIRGDEPDGIAGIAERTPGRDAVRESVQTQFAALYASMSPEAKAGYRHLVDSVYLPHDFDEQVLQQVDRLEHRTPLVDLPLEPGTREGTWHAFGLTPRPDDPGKPLQYVVTSTGNYVMNCFACHGGSVYGTVYPGAPNSLYNLESLTETVRSVKIRQGKPLAHMDVGSMFMPLGTTTGTSNAVMFGVALMNFRDADLNFHGDRAPAPMTNHDMDAPAWWNVHRKTHLYIDGFAEKGHKGLMQFMMVRQNGPKQFRAWEKDFREVAAFLNELRPPKYPLAIDEAKASRGERIFGNHCAQCHGDHSSSQGDLARGSFPETMVSIDDVRTDRVRYDALTPRHRRYYGESWFADYGKQDTKYEVDGYVAPPLNGLWASAPYFHNGSVPTLWHVLHPEERPAVWRRRAIAMDETKIGLVVEELDAVPAKLSASDKRWYFDTRAKGKSASGHDYPNALTEDEKESLLEYLKTL
ncbi:MAG: cytochrome c [Planctomycetota bacterium]|jgi:mono/diheme cytochrome c family protein